MDRRAPSPRRRDRDDGNAHRPAGRLSATRERRATHLCRALLEALDTATDDLLAVDPAELADGELHDMVVELQRHSSRLAALRAKLISAWDARLVWADDGARSPATRLSREAFLSVRSAKIEVTRARNLRSMPNAVAALSNGSLSPDHVDLLARANSGSRRDWFAEHEHYFSLFLPDWMLDAPSCWIVSLHQSREQLECAGGEVRSRRREDQNLFGRPTTFVDEVAALDTVAGNISWWVDDRPSAQPDSRPVRC